MLLVVFHLLGLASLESTRNSDGVGGRLFNVVHAVDGEEIGSRAYILTVDGIEIALAEGKIIHGVEKIGLTHAIVSHQAVDIVRERDVESLVVFEIGEL